jgi:hypothetical protein
LGGSDAQDNEMKFGAQRGVLSNLLLLERLSSLGVFTQLKKLGKSFSHTSGTGIIASALQGAGGGQLRIPARKLLKQQGK